MFHHVFTRPLSWKAARNMNASAVLLSLVQSRKAGSTPFVPWESHRASKTFQPQQCRSASKQPSLLTEPRHAITASERGSKVDPAALRHKTRHNRGQAPMCAMANRRFPASPTHAQSSGVRCLLLLLILPRVMSSTGGLNFAPATRSKLVVCVQKFGGSAETCIS